MQKRSLFTYSDAVEVLRADCLSPLEQKYFL